MVFCRITLTMKPPEFVIWRQSERRANRWNVTSSSSEEWRMKLEKPIGLPVVSAAEQAENRLKPGSPRECFRYRIGEAMISKCH